jgi:hypothetical protein
VCLFLLLYLPSVGGDKDGRMDGWTDRKTYAITSMFILLKWQELIISLSAEEGWENRPVFLGSFKNGKAREGKGRDRLGEM